MVDPEKVDDGSNIMEMSRKWLSVKISKLCLYRWKGVNKGIKKMYVWWGVQQPPKRGNTQKF